MHTLTTTYNFHPPQQTNQFLRIYPPCHIALTVRRNCLALGDQRPGGRGRAQRALGNEWRVLPRFARHGASSTAGTAYPTDFRRRERSRNPVFLCPGKQTRGTTEPARQKNTLSQHGRGWRRSKFKKLAALK